MKKNNTNKTILYAIIALVCFTPVVTFAALDGVKEFITVISGLINPIIRIIFGLAVIFFFWGLAQFILHAGDQKNHEEGKNKMIYGILALFVMISIWGIINWVGGALGIQTNTTQNPPGPCQGGGYNCE